MANGSAVVRSGILPSHSRLRGNDSGVGLLADAQDGAHACWMRDPKRDQYDVNTQRADVLW